MRNNVRVGIWIFLRDHAAGRGVLAPQGRIDQGGGAPHARAHANRLGGAVLGTGAAFHAGITVFDPDPSVIMAQDFVRADHKAHTASNAFFLVKLEGYYIFQVDQASHLLKSFRPKSVS